MRKHTRFLGAVVLLLCWAATGLAGDDESFTEGSASVGAHYGDFNDMPDRVGEYVNLDGLSDLTADFVLDLVGGNTDTLYRVYLAYTDAATNGFEFGLDNPGLVSVDFGYSSFVHNLDDDLLTNLQAREGVPQPDGTFNPGGKQIYHTDNDPLRRYWVEYERFHGEVKVDLPFLENGVVRLGYDDQHKQGYKQRMTIDHCAFCHVEGNTVRVDQRTKKWLASVEGTVGAVSANYDFARTDFADLGGENLHRWKNANHPVNGTAGAEFASRLLFEDVTLPYADGADNEKLTHNAGLKIDLKRAGSLKGSYTHATRENLKTQVKSKFDAYAIGYAKRLNKDMRLTARFLAYETKVDDYFVNLPNFRADVPGANNLDFDWNRISSANRKVYQGDLNLGWRVGKGRHLKVSWRRQTIDRDAMTQSQTTYQFTGLADNEIAAYMPSEAYANETVINRLKLRYDARLGLKGKYNLAYAYTSVDKPFMNPTAMCEESLAGTPSAHVDTGPIGRLYYYQRARYGNGTNQPNQAHKVTARGSYQLSPRTSVSGYLTWAKDKNDEMNLYEFQRDMLTPGVNVWTAPSDRLLFTLGWAYNKVESNANLCPPFFDG
ncbi:MAG: MtrB/PioB family outer membrane beta-barrel protein [bacterium]|nr:MtrB/PioB family outer membrane beta-barrel protein [bacterium]